MKSRALLALLAALLVAAAPSTARAADPVDYNKLKAQADLIVIATPLSVKDLGENTFLPDIQQMGPDGKPVPVAAIGMETNFEVELVLAGNWPANRLVLYHLREASPPAQPTVGGPLLVSFDPKKKLRYLMFLKLDKDGRFESVTGLTDSGLAIKDLGPNP
jgi:hypothetical protein